MKINILLDENDSIIKELNKLGIETDPNSEYILIKRNIRCSYIPVKFEEKSFYLNTKDIIYVFRDTFQKQHSLFVFRDTFQKQHSLFNL